MPGVPSRRARRSRPLPLLAALLMLGLPALAGCGDPEGGRTEVHPEVETSYEEAIRLSLDEVPESELVEIDLRHTEGGAPVWHSTVVTADGTAHTVRLTATTGDLLEPGSPEPGEPAAERTTVLLEESELLPEEAVRQVTKPDFGQVTLVELGESEGRAVWFVEEATVEEDDVRRYAVDAVTGEIVERTELHPSE